MKKSRIATLLVFLLLIPATLFLGTKLPGRGFYITGTLIVLELMVPFFMAFEGRKPQARELVDHRTCQPYGTLHGGASLALAESLAGYGSWAYCAPNEIPVGMQVSGNHISPVKVGNKVQASGRLVHKGSTTHIWDITITTPEGRLVASIRVVNYIIRKK
jgi:uncharacterized protein (TIGR00369 family)